MTTNGELERPTDDADCATWGQHSAARPWRASHLTSRPLQAWVRRHFPAFCVAALQPAPSGTFQRVGVRQLSQSVATDPPTLGLVEPVVLMLPGTNTYVQRQWGDRRCR